jgi:hypothetical protein
MRRRSEPDVQHYSFPVTIEDEGRRQCQKRSFVEPIRKTDEFLRTMFGAPTPAPFIIANGSFMATGLIK